MGRNYFEIRQQHFCGQKNGTYFPRLFVEQHMQNNYNMIQRYLSFDGCVSSRRSPTSDGNFVICMRNLDRHFPRPDGNSFGKPIEISKHIVYRLTLVIGKKCRLLLWSVRAENQKVAKDCQNSTKLRIVVVRASKVFWSGGLNPIMPGITQLSKHSAGKP